MFKVFGFSRKGIEGIKASFVLRKYIQKAQSSQEFVVE